MDNINYATSLVAASSTAKPDSTKSSPPHLSSPTLVNQVAQTQLVNQEQWKHLLVQTQQEPLHVGPTWVKSVPEPQIILRLSGATSITLTDHGITRRYQSQPGDLFVTAANQDPYQLQWHSRSDQPVHSLHLYLSNQLLRQTALQTAGIDASGVELRDGSCLVDPLLQQLCYSLSDELEQPGLSADLYKETVAQLIAVQLLRQHCVLRHSLPEDRGKLSPKRLRQLTDYVLAHLDRTITLDGLASVACLSPYHFCRVFKRTTGLSPNQYVVEQRLKQARQLLRVGQAVRQVAGAVGYASPAHFAHVFLRHVGCSPSQYRESMR